MNPDTQPLRALLETVRGRLRRTRVARAVGLVAAAVCTAVVVSFALDLFLDMPIAVRAVHLVLVVATLAVLAFRATRPLRDRPGDVALASAIEHEVPEFQDRLASALDFERRLSDPSEPESRTMMAAAVREANAIASRLDGTLLVDGRPARRAMLLAAGGGCLVIAAQLTFPVEFGLWLRRGILLEDLSWPRRTTIFVEDFVPETPRVLTRGDDLHIVARVEGSRPADLDLHLVELAEPAEGETEPRAVFTDVRKMFPVADAPGRYAFDLRSVSASYRFWVTGGDDTDDRPQYGVRTMVPPRVAAFRADVAYPAYTGLAPAVVTDPTFEALAGSRITLRFTANMPVASAALQAAEGAAPVVTIGDDARTVTTTFELVRTAEFHLELRSKLGNTNRPDEDVFRVDAVPDRTPTLRMLHPVGRLTTTPDALVPVKILAEDDFGLAEVTLDRQRGRAAPVSAQVWAASPRTPPAAGAPAAPSEPAKKAHVYRGVDLREYAGDAGTPLRAGDVITLVAHAKDAGGAVTDGSEVSVEIVSAEEMSQRLTGEMSRLRDDLLQVRRGQRKSLASLREIEAAGVADVAAVRRGRDVQVEQGRAIGDTARFTTGIERVMDSHVLGRLGSVPTLDRLLPLYERHLAKEPDDSGSVFPAALYAEMISEKRANRLYDPEIIGILLDVLDLSDRLRNEDGPAAYDALDRWTADGPHAPADLAASVAAAAKLLSTLDAIDERLQKFEDLAAIIQLARTIRDGQSVLSRKSAPTENK